MQAQIISFNCVLKNVTGRLISSSFNRDVLTSTTNDALPLRGLAQGLQGLTKGEFRSVYVKAEDAYGLYDPSKVILFPLKKLPNFHNVIQGQTVSIVTKAGATRTYRILHIYGDLVSLDENHPLAGQDLIFEIETVDARVASPDEIADAQNPIFKQWAH